jgi:hypothetical protein
MGDLTIFTSPRSFTGAVDVRQRNAVTSWVLSGYAVLFCGNDPGVEAVADELGVDILPHIGRNDWGTPLISDIFGQAQALLAGQVVAFVNTDILLDDSLGRAAEQAAAKFPQFLIVGRRYDADINSAFNFAGDWQARLRTYAEPDRMHGVYGIDYFCFRAPLWSDIPPFGIGRMRWDNYLMCSANNMGTNTIDATKAVLAVHQAHGYEHIPAKAGKGWTESAECARNAALAGKVMAGVNASRWMMEDGRITSR